MSTRKKSTYTLHQIYQRTPKKGGPYNGRDLFTNSRSPLKGINDN